MTKIINDIDKYIAYIEREIERKTSLGGMKIFFDYSVKFENKEMLVILKNHFANGYSVETRSCPRKLHDITITW